MKKDYMVWSQVDTDGVLHQVIDLLAYVKAKHPDRLAQYTIHYRERGIDSVKTAKKDKVSRPIRKPA